MADQQTTPGSQPQLQTAQTNPNNGGATAVAPPTFQPGWPPPGSPLPPGWGPPPGYVYPPQQFAPQQYPGQPYPPQPYVPQQFAPQQPELAQQSQPQPAQYGQPGQQYAYPGPQYAPAGQYPQPGQYIQPGQQGYPYPYPYPQQENLPPGYQYPPPGQFPPGQMQPGQMQPGAGYAQPPMAYQPPTAQPAPNLTPLAAPAVQSEVVVFGEPTVPLSKSTAPQAKVQSAKASTPTVPTSVGSAAAAPKPPSAAPNQPSVGAQPAPTQRVAPQAATQGAAAKSVSSQPAAPLMAPTPQVEAAAAQPPLVSKTVGATAASSVAAAAVIPPPVTTTASSVAAQVTAPQSVSNGTTKAVAAAPSPVVKKTTPAVKSTGQKSRSSAPGISISIDPMTANPATSEDWARKQIRKATSFAISVFLHILILLPLALMVVPAKDREELFNTIVAAAELPEEVTEKIDDTTIVPEKLDKLQPPTSDMVINSDVISDKPSPIDLDVSDAAPTIEGVDGIDVGGGGPLIKTGSEFAGRTKKGRAALAQSQGGTAASEVAVNTGLKWLSKHQRADGSWSFKHGPDDPGSLDNPMGATGMALLAFLGGGHTHKSGDFKKEVNGGLKFLVSQMKPTGAGGDFRGTGGDMYTQGIVGIALCEAYALSKDKDLKQPTQMAINFIINAQDPKGGGWRYTPGQPGDTSAVGWQVMALKSAKIAKLVVPPKTIGKTTAFLNYVQSNGGANYGYDAPGAGPATTAVGLLCRMYLGWTPKQPGLVKGVEYIGNMGPQPGNMYFNYYSTQIMHHWGGEPWKKWNNVMREYLITTQSKAGASAGSWKPLGAGDHGDTAGGRHYRTCMSIMTLEVYYRHLPLYQRETIKVEF